MDILVGWHIDIEQSQSVIRVMSSCLRSLSPYWISDLSFTVSLLGQLLEDMERYANDYHQLCNEYTRHKEADSSNASVEEECYSLRLNSLRCLAKTMSFMKYVYTMHVILSLFRRVLIACKYVQSTYVRVLSITKETNFVSRVFNAITKTVGQCLSPNSSPALVTWNFLVESLTKVVRTMLLCMETEKVDEELIVTGELCYSYAVRDQVVSSAELTRRDAHNVTYAYIIYLCV